MLGSGFLESSLRTGMEWRPDFIGCDAGTTDGGPYYLGSGRTLFSRAAVKRDVELMLLAAREARIPLLIGSSGTGGSDAQVDWMVDIIREIALERGLRFSLGVVRCEQDREYVRALLRSGRLRPLPSAPALDDATLDRTLRVVGMAGPEPFQRALEAGAEVVIAGRSSDTSIFAAIPVMRGIPPGVAWHAAKILECGAAAVTQRTHPDCMFAWLRGGHFEIEPCNPAFRCSPQSVASHSLYENGDPYCLPEPSGTLDTTNSVYEAVSHRTVRVSGSVFLPADEYTVKLEAVESAGHQTIILGAVRDPVIIRQLDMWIEKMIEAARERVRAVIGDVDYSLNTRMYGRNGVLGRMEPVQEVRSHEVMLVFEVTAASQERATAIAKSVMHIALHYPVPNWDGLITGLALPYSPPELERGVVYRFNMNHLALPTSPDEMFRTHVEPVV